MLPVDHLRRERVQELEREEDVQCDAEALLPKQRLRRGGTQKVVQRAARTQLEDEATVRPVHGEGEQTHHVGV